MDFTYVYTLFQNVIDMFFPAWIQEQSIFQLALTAFYTVWGFWFLDLLLFRPFRFILKLIKGKKVQK